MTYALVATAFIMATIVWWLVRQTLGALPWVEQRQIADDHSGDGFPMPPVAIGLGVFMTVATSLFALSISAYLLAGGASTVAFLAGQLWAWRQLDAAGYYLTTNPANAFFYFLTALHALHLLGGLWVWGATAVRVQRGAAVRDVRLRVELCAIYWHFLLMVWLILFGLLLLT